MNTVAEPDPKPSETESIRQGRITGVWRIVIISTVLAVIALFAVWAFYA